jgi:hypothetical protein
VIKLNVPQSIPRQAWIQAKNYRKSSSFIYDHRGATKSPAAEGNGASDRT